MNIRLRISLEFLLILVFICVMVLLLCQLSDTESNGLAMERHETAHIGGLQK